MEVKGSRSLLNRCTRWLQGPQRKEKLDKVKALPRENSKENFLGLIRSMGRNDTARPKQIMPKTKLVMNPIIRCFLVKLGNQSSAFLASQLCEAEPLPVPSSTWEQKKFSNFGTQGYLQTVALVLWPTCTPRKGSSSSCGLPVPPPKDLIVFRVGSLKADNFEVTELTEEEVVDRERQLFRSELRLAMALLSSLFFPLP